MFSQASICPQGVRGHVWQGDAWQRGISDGGVAGGAWQGGMHGGGHAWQERQPLQQTIRIPLECILVLKYILTKHEGLKHF